jgi:hypothetical protein
MKKLSCLAAVAIVILSVCWYAPAQQAKAPEPLPDNASLEETGKWLVKALRKNFSFPANDKAGVYLIDDLKFDDCLLTFNLVREGLNTGGVAVVDTSTSSNGNKTKQDRIGGKVTAPLDPNTREPRIDVGTDPNHFPAPQGAPRHAKSDRKVLDTQMFDLYEIDPASFQILKMPQAPGISYLLMVNRALTEKGPVSVQAKEVRSEPRSATTGQLISQKPGGIIALKEISVAPIKAGFEHALKLCQGPK